MISFIAFLVSCVAFVTGGNAYTKAALKAHAAGDEKIENRLHFELGVLTIIWVFTMVWFLIQLWLTS